MLLQRLGDGYFNKSGSLILYNPVLNYLSPFHRSISLYFCSFKIFINCHMLVVRICEAQCSILMHFYNVDQTNTSLQTYTTVYGRNMQTSTMSRLFFTTMLEHTHLRILQAVKVVTSFKK